MMTSVGSNAERDRWVEVLGLSPQLVAFMMQEHSVKQDNRAPHNALQIYQIFSRAH
jgi:hypothetical protein